MQQQAAIEQHVETTATRVNDVMAEFCQIIDSKAKETVQGLQVIEALAQELFFVGINAGIQAAQAGEAGRAFSVVANQIRDMAGKTLENTRAVRQLLDLAPVLADMAQRRQETCTMMTQVSGDIHAASDRVRTTFANIQAGLGHIGDNNSVMNDMLEISQDALRRQTVKVSQSQTLTEALGGAARGKANYSQIATSHGVRVDTGYDRLEDIVARGVLPSNRILSGCRSALGPTNRCAAWTLITPKPTPHGWACAANLSNIRGINAQNSWPWAKHSASPRPMFFGAH